MTRHPSRATNVLTVTLAMVLATTFVAQQLSSAEPLDQQTAKLVTDMLPKFHLSQTEVDDSVSSILVERYVESLDPQKLYFMKEDIERLKAYRTSLDDALQAGNVSFAYDTFDLYRDRLNKRMELAHSLVDAEHDFTVDEQMVVDADKVPWTSTEEEIRERWRQRIKYDMVQLLLDGEPMEEIRERLHRRYRTIKLSVELTEPIDVLEIFLTALTECYDPHSSYMSPNTLEDFQINMRLSLDGIGAALRSEDGYTEVVSIVPGGAADKDGRLEVGDTIIGVGQGPDGKIEDVVEMKLSRVVRLIRGERGTIVRLQIKPKAGGETKIYNLTRQKIELKESEVKGEILESNELMGRTGRVGVLRIPSFYRDFAGASEGQVDFKSAARDVAAVLQDFEKQGGVDVVVVDLRGNGGGALSEAIEVSGLFIDQGPVVQVRNSNGRVESHRDEESGVAYAGPLVVVCNRLSASASEIFAGVIKDYRRGIVVGDTTTHGKGTVQNVMPVAPTNPFSLFRGDDVSRGALKLTIQQFYRVNGDSTQEHGVPSDIVLPSMIDHADFGEAFLDNAMAFDQIGPARYSMGRFASPQIIARLQEMSEERVEKDPEFQDVEERIAKFLERKNREFISLNKDKQEQERDEIEQEQEDAEEEEEEASPHAEGPVWPEGYYNNEIVQIALDYVDLLGNGRTVQR